MGKDGAFVPLLESILNAALEGEMDARLTEDERLSRIAATAKCKNKSRHLWAKWLFQFLVIAISPSILNLSKKRETILAEGVADRIIGLYAMGNSTREISGWMEENLGNRVSADTISSITDRVLPEIKA